MAERAWFSTRATLDEVIKGRGPYRVADVLGAGGGFALGAVLEGFELAAKREDPAAVGVGLMMANKPVLGQRWNAQAGDPDKWRKVTADVVVSVTADAELAEVLTAYTAALKPAVLILDTVPDVFEGAELAQRLRKLSGLVYRPTAVVYNELSLGGVLDRRRQFTLLSQVPIGVDRVALDWIPAADEAVMDLLELEPTWDLQRVYRAPTWYSRALRSPDHTVDGFMTARDYRSPSEWAWSRTVPMPSPDGVFPVKGRDGHRLTHREIARLMGFPDAWRLGTVKRGLNDTFLGAHWERGTAVHAARWILRWVHRSLDGRPGPLRGERLDVADDWLPAAALRWGDRSR